MHKSTRFFNNFIRKYNLKRSFAYITCIVFVIIGVGCSRDEKVLNKRVTLWRKDDIPYGNSVAFDNLKYIFPKAEITVTKKSPDRYKSYSLNDIKSFTQPNEDDVKSAYIIISPDVSPDNAEVIALLDYAGNGNSVFISSFHLGKLLQDSLHVKTAFNNSMLKYDDSLRVSVNDPVTTDSSSYAYPGLSSDNYFSVLDSTYAVVLGRDEEGYPDFIRYTYKGGGAIYVHLAPTALTNFFLLHKDNMKYYDKVFSYMPDKFKKVKWDDYFRYHSDGNSNGFSALNFLSKHESFRWALWLVLLLFAILFAFGAKRRQRIIPVVKPPNNSSLDFVKTIGHLYYQRRDNKNLAEKMVAHFLEYVRGHYILSTAVLDEEFVKRLAIKSGKDITQLQDLIYTVKSLRDYPALSDEELLVFNSKLEHFYKN